MRKTLYFDIETQVKVKKISKKTGAKESEVVRHAVKRVTFDQMVYELNQDMRLAKYITRKNLLK